MHMDSPSEKKGRLLISKWKLFDTLSKCTFLSPFLFSAGAPLIKFKDYLVERKGGYDCVCHLSFSWDGIMRLQTADDK